MLWFMSHQEPGKKTGEGTQTSGQADVMTKAKQQLLLFNRERCVGGISV